MSRMAASLERFRQNPFARYLCPFLAFCVFSSLSSLPAFQKGTSVFWIYGVRSIVTLLLFIYFFRGHWREIEGRFDWKAVLVGLAVLAVWLAPVFAGRSEQVVLFNPAVFNPKFGRVLAVSARLAGSAIIAPLIEEIVWRSFLMRFLISQDFLSVPLGTYRGVSFWVTVLTFALMHPMWQWGPAIFAGVLYGAYLVKTRNLAGCILAHSVTNLGLGIYIIVTGRWGLWV